MISTKMEVHPESACVYPSNFPKIDHIPKAIASITEQNPKDKDIFKGFEEKYKIEVVANFIIFLNGYFVVPELLASRS